MTQEASQARGVLKHREAAIKEAESLRDSAQRAVEAIERTCRHQWSEAKYTPKVTEAYTIPGDARGTMGIDWRGPMHVPRTEEPRWTRECSVCGKVETTTRSTEQVRKIPAF